MGSVSTKNHTESIAVIDSGIGGLLVLQALVKRMPKQSFVYVGDQLHAPYGEKAKDQIFEYASGILEYLLSRGVRRVVVACNTTCATVMKELKEAFPTLTLYGIVELTCSQLDPLIHQSVLVLATPATIRSRGYEEVIERLFPSIVIHSLAAPRYVVAVENAASAMELREISQEYLSEFKEGVDTVILGCTHFPYVSTYIKEVLDVKLINSNEVVAAHVAMQEGNATDVSLVGSLEFYTTKNVERFKAQVQTIFSLDQNIYLLEL